MATESAVLAQIDMTLDGHWLWTGRLDKHGYGRIGKSDLAHRVVYGIYHGDVPPELEYVCRVRCCVRPHLPHVEPTSHRTNVLRGESPAAHNARVTHCPRQHEYDERNTYVDPKGRRYCRACNAARKRGEL